MPFIWSIKLTFLNFRLIFFSLTCFVTRRMQVSTQMNQTCVTVLNSTFSKLQTQLMKRFENIKKVMPRRWVVFAQHSPSTFVEHSCIDEINVYRALMHRIARESSQVCGNFIQNEFRDRDIRWRHARSVSIETVTDWVVWDTWPIASAKCVYIRLSCADAE